VCRADDARVPRWYIADQAHPERAAAEHT